MLIGFALGGTTGYAINPARDLGPRLAHSVLPIRGKGSSDWAYAFVPILGPALGSLLGAASYQILYKNDLDPKYLIVMGLVAVILIAAVVKNVKDKK
jgi:glycerol uptake facilitator protein